MIFKESKINKSPIESILQESFEQEASAPYNHQMLPQHNQPFNNLEHA